MTNVFKRLLNFIIAIPILILLVIYFPYADYIWIMLFLTAVSLISGLELQKMLIKFDTSIRAWMCIFPAIAPILSWMTVRGWIPAWISVFTLLCGMLWAFASPLFCSENQINQGIQRIGIRLIIVIYPGFFLWWVHNLTSLPHTKQVLLLFLFLVTLNDSAAWLIGNLLGRHRNIIKVSPGKSLEGFIAGILISIAVTLTASYFYPDLLPHPLWQLIAFGFISGMTTILGDLVESLLKRSAGVKDSGKLIAGRGGILDSIDSWLFTAPITVLFIQMGAAMQ